MSTPGYIKNTFFITAVLALMFVLAIDSRRISDWSLTHQKTAGSENQNTTALFTRGFVTEDSPTPSVHAPAVAELSDGTILSVWYGGEREGAGDVALYSSRLNVAAQSWTEPVKSLSRQRVSDDLGVHIRKLGNAVLLAGENQSIWMFFVTASIGGWSTSSINMVYSSDGGKNWGRVKRLVTSPFLNLSTLTKGHPFFYKDGTIGLPVYHELAGKFAELLRVDIKGEVKEKIRMTKGRHKIQPDIAVIGEDLMVAVLRDSSPERKLFQMSSTDSGRSWSTLYATPLPNPDAAVSIAGNSEGVVLAYNDSAEHRNPLSLAFSNDQGKSWKKIADIEASELREDNNKDEFSYPYIIQSRDGTYHLVYTWKREQVAYVSFNKAWIDSRL
jgi:predicted neuraminidase